MQLISSAVEKFHPESNAVTLKNGESLTYDYLVVSAGLKVDWSKIRNTFTPKSCPLGGRKGPKIDWTNVTLLQRFLTDGGNIKPRRVTKVGSPPMHALALANAVLV